jgi:FKBP-type peptidyl-prolyl cis-trans isomerase
MLGSGEVVKGLELGLYDMCIGERRVLRVPPALAFGDRGSRVFGVPGGATLEYDVRLRGINLQYDPKVRREDLMAEDRY